MIPLIILGAMAGLQIIGGIMQAQQIRAAGQYAKKVGKYQRTLAENQAQSMEAQAGQELAASQREMLAQRQQGALISGRARALAAASGADLSSPTLVSDLAAISNSEENRVGMSRFQGENAAANLRYGAGITRAQGQASAQAGTFENRLANARANSAILGSIIGAAGTGMAASNYVGSGSGQVSNPPPPSGGQMSQYQMGWSSTPSLLQSSSPMYAKYGQGGP